MEGTPLVGGENAAELVGFADPYGLSLGFLVPIFRQPGRNSPVVQVVDGAGRISAFEPCDPPDVEMIDVPPTPVERDSPELWGFQFEDRLIFGNDECARQMLEELLEARLGKLPLLAMEVAEFLELSDRRDRYARLAYDQMAQVSLRAAKAWRDLSVLTPDIRAILLKRLGHDAKWPRRILATLETSTAVAIHGLHDWPNRAVAKALRAAVNGATKDMPRLYDGGTRKSLVYPTPPHKFEGQARVRLVVDRAIDPGQLGWRLRRIGSTGIELVGWDSRDAFEEQDYPTIALTDGLNEERLSEVARHSPSAPIHILAYGSPSAGHVADIHSFGKYPGLLIQIPGGRSKETQEPTDIVTIETAVSIVLEIVAGRLAPPAQYTVLVTAATSQQRGDPSGMVALYDEAYALGLIPWNAVHLTPLEPKALGPRDQSVADLLFPNIESLASGGWRPPGAEWHATHALLVSPESRSDGDELRHRQNVVRLFETLGWQVGEVSTDLRRFEIKGGAASLAVRSESLLTRAELSAMGEGRGFKFGRIGTLRIAPNATAETVVRHLAHARELAAQLDDLLLLDGSRSTIWEIVIAQIRRLFASPARRAGAIQTFYLRALVREAISLGRHHPDLDSRVVDGLAAADVGKTYQLVAERVIMRDNALRAKVVFLSREGSDQMAWKPETTFVLQVAPDGPSIEPFGRTRQGKDEKTED